MEILNTDAEGCGCILLIALVVTPFIMPETRVYAIIVAFIIISTLILAFIASIVRDSNERKERERKEAEEHETLMKQIEEEERREEEEYRRLLEERDRQIEKLLQRDTASDQVNYMTGVEFEQFIANVFDMKRYSVQTTPASGDQGVDLILDIDGRRVAVQLKRYTAPVGNAAIQAVFSGMIHYKVQEAWVIATSSFTRSALELAKSTGVRLIAGEELANWLSDLRDETSIN